MIAIWWITLPSPLNSCAGAQHFKIGLNTYINIYIKYTILTQLQMAFPTGVQWRWM